jgi:hypothetical protein
MEARSPVCSTKAPPFSAVHKQYQGFTIALPAAVKPREGRPWDCPIKATRTPPQDEA